MKKIYVLLQSFPYEGYSAPCAAWSRHPSDQEIFDFLAPKYISDQRSWKFKTLEETRNHDSEQLWKNIREKLWEIEECELFS